MGMAGFSHRTMRDARRDDFGSQTLVGLVFVGCCGMVLLPESILLWFACLRENKTFWTNAGGYSLELRDAVLWFFFPLLLLNLLLLSCLTFVFVTSLRPPLGMIVMKLCALLACWGLLGGAMAVSGADNLLNLLEGRPLHQRKDSRSRPRPVPMAGDRNPGDFAWQGMRIGYFGVADFAMNRLKPVIFRPASAHRTPRPGLWLEFPCIAVSVHELQPTPITHP